ncbi:MAG TPA: 4a-hydroxytetrahydrobiopterin dehydratase [Acidobacteriota bacterium]|nr:4a-hydroxytetrahydrobiopterin dehydratase [Acidobacteriota bacterium]
MSELARRDCDACKLGAPLVTDAEAAELRQQIPAWQLVETDGIKQLTRTFQFSNFAAALAFTREIGAIAEEANHHPRLVTEWGRVGVTWWTHKIRGLHVNDFIMAARVDAIAE